MKEPADVAKSAGSFLNQFRTEMGARESLDIVKHALHLKAAVPGYQVEMAVGMHET